jgi:paraquat-inducible protein A
MRRRSRLWSHEGVRRVIGGRRHGEVARGRDLGLVSCEACELVMRATHDGGQCPRCNEPVRGRKVNGNGRAWALLLAAAVLYIPANAMVMMKTTQFTQHRADTIMSGIQYLWRLGDWELAVIVFIASIFVPILKLAALATLLVTSGVQSHWRPRGRTAVYRVLEVIGHWSMLDVFVVSLLTAVVQLGRFAEIEPGPAVLPFAAVVVLTMLASASFDPRAIWDWAPEPAQAPAMPAAEPSRG